MGMKIRRRLALLLSALAIVIVAGCTQPSGTGGGPGASAQPAASEGGIDY